MPRYDQFKKAVAGSVLAVLGFLWSCSSGPSISADTGKVASKGSKGDDDDETHSGKGGKGGSGDPGDVTLDTGGGDEGGGGGGELTYPTFHFNGKGNSICGSMNHVLVINVTTKIGRAHV